MPAPHLLLLHGVLALVALQAAAGAPRGAGRTLQSVDELPEGQAALQNGCEATQVAECQAAGKVCFNKACVEDACDAGVEALKPRCRAVCNQMAPSLAYVCSTCDGKVVCTRDNHLPILGAITKRRVRVSRAMRAAQKDKLRKDIAA